MHKVCLDAGMEAPHFELPDADMKSFVLTSQRGRKNVVLYFYSRDNTPGCTIEANEFSELYDDLARLDTIVVGISRDDCLSHASFRDKHGLSVLLLSDPDARVCKRYGVLVEKEACPGKKTDGICHPARLPENGGQAAGHEPGQSVESKKKHAIKRSTFVIDKQGMLRHVMYGVQAHGHAQEIFNLIKELK